MNTEDKVKRPDIVEDEHLEFLDDLREGGTVNMFAGGIYLEKEFLLSRKDARTILGYWMDSFSERHPK